MVGRLEISFFFYLYVGTNTVVFQGVVMLSRTRISSGVDCLKSSNRYECQSEVSRLYTAVRNVGLEAKACRPRAFI